ncbi:hypothetical protein PENTCL1PPCAC_17052, partial [Pristionchus entomophagus]
FSILCKIRKSGEFGTYVGVGCNAQFRSTKPVFFPSTYSLAIPNARIFYSAIIDLCDSVFEDFRDLSADSKAFIANTTYTLFSALDSSFRAAHFFPEDDTVFVSYATTLTNATVESFFDDCINDIKEAVAEFRKNICQWKQGNVQEVIAFNQRIPGPAWTLFVE